MRFCSACGAPVEFRVPAGDSLPRHVCTQCGIVHYENPKIIVGCIPQWQDQRILLCRRGIEPRMGLWTVPAGFMENGETTAEGAVRETLEEANARVEILGLYALYNIPHINQVYMLFRARLLDLAFSAGAETLEAKLFAEGEIPWEKIAFATVHRTLRQFFSDSVRGEFPFHIGTIERASKPTPDRPVVHGEQVQDRK